LKSRTPYASSFDCAPFRRLCVTVVFVLLAFLRCQGQDRSREYQVKAIFLYNFTQFVEWPPSAFKEKNSPLIIGIAGKDPFGSYLDEAVKNEKIGEHPLVVHRFETMEDVTGCHILFVNIPDKNVLREHLHKLAERSVLTVGDTDHFIRDGGMVRFVPDNNKIRMQINVTAARDAGLIISSKLLRLAEIVSSKK